MTTVLKRVQTASREITSAHNSLTALAPWVEETDMPDRIKDVFRSAVSGIENAMNAMHGDDFREVT